MSTYNIPAPESTAPSTSHDYELIEPGDYDLEIIYATDRDSDGVRLTTKAGDPRIKIKLMADDEKSFYHFLYLSEKAFPMVWEFLQACGMNPAGEEFVLDPQKLEGKRFRATVYVENGWNRLRRPIPIPRPNQSTPDPAIAESHPFGSTERSDLDVPF